MVDVLTNELVVVELKSVDEVIDIHIAQLSSSMCRGDFPIYPLINFRVTHYRKGIHRRVNSPSSRLSNSSPFA